MRISLYSIIVTLCVVIALFFDLVLGLHRLPILTLIVCGIVGIYEIVSPFIYTPR